MKRLTALFALLLSTLLVWGQEDPYARLHEGERLPDFEVAMTNGTTLRTADLEGKVVWICLWASWCPSCRREFKWLHQSEEFATLGEQEDFVFLPISREENSATITAWLRKKGYDILSGVDPDRKVYELFAEQEIPRNIIVGKDGVVVLHSSACSRKTIAGVIETVEKLLN